MKFANTIALSLVLAVAAFPAVILGSGSIQSVQAQEIESETMDTEAEGDAGESAPAGTEAESTEITPNEATSTDSSTEPDTGIGGAEPDTNVNEETEVQEEVNTAPETQPVQGLW